MINLSLLKRFIRSASYIICRKTGLVLSLIHILAIEFSVGIGYLDTEYRKYTSYGNDLVWVSSGKYHFIGPTKAKVSLVWHNDVRIQKAKTWF